MSREIRGFIYSLWGVFFYTVMAIIIKLCESVSIETLVFFRNLVPLLLILPPLFRKKVSIKTKQWKLYLIRAVFGFLAIYCRFITIRYIPMVDGIVLSNTVPLFIPLIILAWLHLTISPRKILAVCIGFIGVLVILKPSIGIFHPMALFGVAAGAFGATALVTLRKLTKTEGTERILFYFFLTSTLLSFFPMLFTWTEVKGISWLYILALSVVTIFFHFCITRAYTYLPATETSAIMYFSVILGWIFSWMIWGIIPDFWSLAGSVLIVLGGLIAIFDPGKAKPISRKKKSLQSKILYLVF